MLLAPLLTGFLGILPQDAPSASRPDPDVVHMAVVQVRPLQARRFSALGLDVAHLDLVAGRAEVIVDEADLATLDASGLPYEVTIRDLASYYARRLADPSQQSPTAATYGAWLSPPFASGSMGGYYPLAQLESVLDQMRAAYPSLISARQSIGQSIQGRDLWMVRISDNPDVDENEPEVRIDSLHHAREPQGMQCNLWFMLYLLEEYGNDPLATYLVNERELYFVPCVNPDGYEYNHQTNPNGGGMWRKNRRSNGGGSFGVDLNRNYPYQWGFNNSGSSSDPNSETYRGTGPASEPEVQAMVSFISGHSFGTAVSLHTYSNLWLSPFGYDALYPANWDEFVEVGTLATEVNHYPHGPASIILYLANGVTVDYDHGQHGSLSWTPEIGSSSDGFWPPQSRIVPLAEENLLALIRSALAGGAWVRTSQVSLIDGGDGDGSFEKGETVELYALLRNSGTLDSSNVDLTLTTTSPWATVGVGSVSAGTVARFSDGGNAAPLTLDLASNTPGGTIVPYTLTVTYGGWSQDYEGSFAVGTIVIDAWDFEATGNQGWGIGSPNDASTGNWVRVDPNGTAAQPEDDHTPAPGVTCWVTGQGSVGGSIGENDVDGGSTTLVSPVFDLSSGASPHVRYWRWYSNNGNGTADDFFQIDLSNDGGSSWVSAEILGPGDSESGGGWFEADLDVETLLTPTSQMRIRFIASDLGGGSIVEAAIDDVRITVVDDSGGGCVTSTYCNPGDGSSNNTATIAVSGCDLSGSVVLSMAGGPASQFAYALIGDGTTVVSQPPGSIGDLCVVGGSCLGRYAKDIGQISGAGTFSLDLSNSASGGPNYGIPVCGGTIQAGDTWNFQFWHRNPMGAPSSFSEAISVTFQ